MVLMLFAFVLVVGLGVVSVASTSSGQTSVMLTQRQADLTAQSILDAVVAKIKDNTINPATAAANPNAISGSNPKLGSYNYKITDVSTSVGPNCYKISVEASYPNSGGAHSKMNRIVQGTLVQTVPSFTSIAQSMAGPDTIGNANISGTVYADETNNSGQTLNLNQGGSCNGYVYVKGNVTLSDNYRVTGNVYTSAATNAKGDILMQGGSNVTGNIYASGDVTLQNGASVNGSIYAKGQIKVYYCTVTDSQNPNYPVAAYTTPTASSWPVPTNITATQTADFNTGDVKVTQNCILTLRLNNGALRNLTFDTTVSNQDMYIMLATPAMNAQTVQITNTNFLVQGTHNVYLFLDDGTNYVNFTVLWNNSYLGNAAYANGSLPTANFETPHLYFISNKQSNIQFNGGNVTLYGYVYAPNGSASMSGNGRFNSYMLYGGIVAKQISFGSMKDYYYLPNLQNGGGGGGTVNWSGTNCKVLGTYAGY